MRLTAVENPPGIFLKIAYWFSRRQFGKVLSPLKVIYARKPELLKFAMKIDKFERRQTSLAPELRLLIKLAAASENGCSFCQDIALAQAVRHKLGAEKFLALAAGGRARAGIFTPAERAALAAVGEYAARRRVGDETFAELRRHFSEMQIVEILALHAFEQFYNALTIPLEIESDGLRSLAEAA